MAVGVPLSCDAVRAVELKLGGSLSLRAIARATGLGKTSVQRIAEGQRQHLRGQRCPGCGGLPLVLPCKACATRAALEAPQDTITEAA